MIVNKTTRQLFYDLGNDWSNATILSLKASLKMYLEKYYINYEKGETLDYLLYLAVEHGATIEIK